MRTAAQTLAALRALPCGERLLGALGPEDRVWLVGGAVRDLLLGRTPRELDLVTEGDPDELAARLGVVVKAHDRFGTATIEDGECRMDVARARTERYAAPGALPEVQPGSLREDLRRRDFTVNAFALAPDGELLAVPDGFEDLAGRRLRVLHRTSFIDDPTRLWRLARYAARLGFTVEEHTGRRAQEAVEAGALATVSAERLTNELRLACAEPDPAAALTEAARWNLVPEPDADFIRTVHSGQPLLHAFEPQTTAGPEATRDVEPDADGGEVQKRLAELHVLVVAVGESEGWALTAQERRAVERVRAVVVPEGGPPSAVAEALRGEPPAVAVIAAARGSEAARWWLEAGRHVALEIDGSDLIAAGVAEGPELGERLRRVLALVLDGELEGGRDAQLRAALGSGP